MKSFFIDAHCDTITKIMYENENLYKNKYQIDLERLQHYKTPVQFFAIWLHPRFYQNPLLQTMKGIDYFYEEIKKNDAIIGYAGSIKDIERNISQNKISAILTVEGGEALEGQVEIIRILYRLGVRSMTLTWNYQNSICHGAMEEEAEEGLSNFGIEIIKEMNSLGMIVDVSHLSQSGFWDVKKISTKPFIASHSNVRAICDHPRNLSDEQLKAIGEVNGVIGVNSYPPFLNASSNSKIEDFLIHIDYIVNLIGIDHVGLGCDFDGINVFTKEMEDVSTLSKVSECLEKKYGCTGAEKILYKNFYRVMKEIFIE